MSAKPLRLDPSEVRLEEVMGSGTLGLVYRGRIRENLVTVKVLPFDNEQKELIEDFKSEIELPLFIRHPNLCLFMGYTLEHPFMVVDEYLERGMVEAMKDPAVRRSFPVRIRMAREIALGISWLHRNHFVHLNLKPSNVFVYGRYSVKLADYNLKKTRRNLSVGGSRELPYWKAPEVLFQEFEELFGTCEAVSKDDLEKLRCLYVHEKSESCDVYSFSVLLWQLVTLREPSITESDELLSHLRCVVIGNRRPYVEDVVPDCLRRLIVEGWDADPRRRPSISDALKSLEFALVDCLVSDPLANRFWKDRVTEILESEQISWKKFCNAFFEFLGFTQPGSLGIIDLMEIDHYRARDVTVHSNVKCLHKLFADKEYVTLEEFGRMIDRFGPISARNRGAILDRIRTLLSRPWFHGDMTAEEAKSKLFGKQVVESGIVQHHRIRRCSDAMGEARYMLGKGSAETIDELIRVEGEVHLLLFPLPGSRYSCIFGECLTPEYGIIRLMLQFMKENKLAASFDALQKESQISLNTVPNPEMFATDIKQGHWDNVLSTMASLHVPMYKQMNLYEHVVLELVELKEVDVAHALLRQTQALTVMKQTQQERYRRLEGLLARTYVEPKELYPYGSREKRRQEISRELMSEVVVVEPSRLLTLLSQALKYQKSVGMLKDLEGGREGSAQPFTERYDLFRGRVPTIEEEDEIFFRTCSRTMQFDIQACPEVACFSPDGSMLAVGLINGFIEIYDPKTGKLNTDLTYQEKDEFMVHKGAVLCLGFCKQGDFMLSGDQFGDIKLWKLSTGQCVRMFESAHSDGVTSVSFSKDNDQILSTSFDQTVRIHGVKSAKTLKIFRGHTSYVNKAIWTSDGQIISVSSDGYIRVWNLQTEDCIRCFQINPTCPELKKPIHTVSFIPNGYQDHFIVSDRSSQIQVMNKQGEILKTYSLSKSSPDRNRDTDDDKKTEFTAVSISPKGNWIYAVATDLFLYCFSVSSGEVEHSIKLHNKEIIGIHHHPFKNTLLSFSANGELKLWRS